MYVQYFAASKPLLEHTNTCQYAMEAYKLCGVKTDEQQEKVHCRNTVNHVLQDMPRPEWTTKMVV